MDYKVTIDLKIGSDQIKGVIEFHVGNPMNLCDPKVFMKELGLDFSLY
jgi:hypothetical protein